MVQGFFYRETGADDAAYRVSFGGVGNLPEFSVTDNRDVRRFIETAGLEGIQRIMGRDASGNSALVVQRASVKEACAAILELEAKGGPVVLLFSFTNLLRAVDGFVPTQQLLSS